MLFGRSLKILLTILILSSIMNVASEAEAPMKWNPLPRYKEDYGVTLLAKLIEAEARGEPYEGKVAVGAVVMNRVNDERFPDTIYEVIHQPMQFKPSRGLSRVNPSTESIRAAKEAMRLKDPTGGALYFYNPELTQDTWITRLPVVAEIGNHVFSCPANQ